MMYAYLFEIIVRWKGIIIRGLSAINKFIDCYRPGECEAKS